MKIAAQVIIYIDDAGDFRAEAAPHGMATRRKLDLRDGLWEPLLRAELMSLSEHARANKEENEKILAQNKRQSHANKTNRIAQEIYDNVAKKHSIPLADRVVPKLRGRAHKQAAKAKQTEVVRDL